MVPHPDSYRDWTLGHLIMSQVLLFYKWSHKDLNLGPPDYESGALTNWAMGPKIYNIYAFFKADAKLRKYLISFKFFNEKFSTNQKLTFLFNKFHIFPLKNYWPDKI